MRRWLRRAALTATLGSLVAAGAVPARAQSPPTDSVRRLSLDDALGAAEGASEDVLIARAADLRARGQEEKAHSQFLPQIYGSASYTRTLRSQFQGLASGSDTAAAPPACSTFRIDSAAPLAERVRTLEQALGCSPGGNFLGSLTQFGFGAANQYSLGLSLSQNLFTGGRITAQSRQAASARRGAGVALASARAQAMLDVAQAYYDAVLGDRLLEIAEATLQQADATLSRTRLARQVGNQPEFDLLRAQVTRDNQVPVVIQRRSSRDIAYVRLEQLLNIPVGTRLVLTTELGDTARVPSARLASVLAAAPDTSVEARAPVRQALENLASQRNGVTIARSQRVPTLTITSAYGRVAYPQSGLPDWNRFLTNWTITAGIQVPIYTGGSIHGDESMAEAGERDAEARLRQTRKLAELDTRNSLAQLRAAEAQFAASEGTAGQAARAYQIAELRYDQGISTQTELTDTRIQLEQARANRAQAARDLQVARLRMALLRDLPLAGTGATQGTQPPASQSVQQLQQPTPSAPPTAPQPVVPGVVQASQSGGVIP